MKLVFLSFIIILITSWVSIGNGLGVAFSEKERATLNSLVGILLGEENDELVIQQYARWIRETNDARKKIDDDLTSFVYLQNLKRQRRNAIFYPKPPPSESKLLYLHVYKTGGTSVDLVLNTLCTTRYQFTSQKMCLPTIPWKSNALPKVSGHDTNLALFNRHPEIKSAWAEAWRSARMVYGHWWMEESPENLLEVGPEDRVVTVLRDPLLTEISSLFYLNELDALPPLSIRVPKKKEQLQKHLSTVVGRLAPKDLAGNLRVDFMARLGGAQKLRIDWQLSFITSANTSQVLLRDGLLHAMENLFRMEFVTVLSDLSALFHWIKSEFGPVLPKDVWSSLIGVHENAHSPVSGYSLETIKSLLSNRSYQILRDFTLYDRHLFLFASALNLVRQ